MLWLKQPLHLFTLHQHCSIYVSLTQWYGRSMIQFLASSGNTFVVVPENTPVGSKIGVLTLSNGNNLKITSKSSYVSVTDVTGSGSIQVDLILNTKLDHDYGPTQLQLTFEGRNDEVQNVNFQLLLFVNDVNDESPLLKNQPYSVTVPENTAQNVVVSDKITAEDPDEGDTQTYRLETNAQGADDEYRNMFSIGNDGKLTLKGQLDFETTRFYQYTVIVEDKVGHNDSAAVYITVEDVQDTPPYFTGEPFINTIPEDWATGQPILTIRAADGDKGIPNSVRLNIKTESCPGLFQLDATSGELSLKTSADRDSGTVKNQNGICKLEVEATEGTEHVQTTGSSSSASTNVTITVSDINDNGPAFKGTPYSATVDENTQAGVPISLTSPITVEDSDQGENAQVEVKLKTYTEYFEVSPPLVQSTGQILIRVKNSTLLDYEKVQQLEIELEATDTKSPRLTTSAQVTLKINNINDNDPIFTKSSYSTSVSEDASTGFSVIKIEAPDADKNDGAHKYGDVQYSLDGAESSFEIDPDTGVVSVGSNKLDRELRESYYLTVIAEDGGKRKVSTRLDIIIDDVNDNPPEFVTNDYQTSLKELETAFSRPVKVQATDKDKPNTKASEIQYSITATIPTGLESHFSIDDGTGKLDVKTALEYDHINFPSDHAGQIEVHVMAKDKGQPSLNSSVTVVVILQDVNNQSPVCDSNKYTVEILEGQIKASEVQQITAHDDDGSAPNNLLMYSIDPSFADKFVMNSTSGMLSLRDKLDREERDHYDISVTVMDLGVPAKSGQCVVSVTVKDINDEPPKFNQRETKVSFPENKDGFTLPCPAQDKDLNFTLSYSISWQNSSAISPSGQTVDLQSLKNGLQIDNKGIITSSIQFDREKLQQFILFVVVTDDNSVTGKQADTATVTVSIQDENDESPTFSASTYKAEIPENSPNGTEVQFGNSQSLTVTDKDESPNNEFSVRLDTYQDYFTIASPTGSERMQFTLSVKDNSILDYEQIQQLELQVITTDTNKPSFHNTATVSLSIINRNDNQPQFISATFSGSVKENQPSGTSVTTIQATDDDKGDFGKLTYSLPETLPEFTINQTTGEVFTAKEFDREVKDSYSMLVRVQDGGNYRTETQLTVDIVDLNDETPVFKQSHLEFEIAENQMYFIPALMVEAFDYDKVDTVNSDIKYSIISSNPPAVRSKFSINANTSEITLNSTLDYEALDESLHGRILLTVEAKDQGSPQRSTTTTVTILVKDVNDISPHFDSNIYNIHKPENTSTGSTIFNVSAVDHDATKENTQVSYSIDTLSGSTFTIGKDTGIIQLKTELNYETVKEYNITVTAVDSGKPALTSTTVVHLAVDDVNDVNPVFDQKQMSNSVDENKNLTFTCTAQDQDVDNELRYNIVWSQSEGRDGKGGLINGAELQKWVQIAPKICKVTSMKALDREAVSVFTLKLQVKDIKGQTNTDQTDTASLVIQVNDVNDEPPKFVGSNVRNASIRENMPRGSDIKFDDSSFLEVSDADEGANSEFEVTLLKANNIFSISPTTGMSQETFSITVQNSSALDFEKCENFTLEVLAKGTQQGNKYSSTATIVVKVINENDNIPEFVGAPFSASVKEEQQASAFVTTVEAKDADKGQFGEIYFSLPDDITEFRIDEKSGDVSTKIKLDRETKDSYVVPVKVRDSGNFSSITQLTITVTDINDKSPEFASSQFTATVTEGAETFPHPLIAQANDNDAQKTANSQIKYSLSNVPGKLGSVFHINDTTGEITLTSPLDYEDLEKKGLGSVLQFNVTATDQGTPQNSASARVVITVKDANDVAPQFNQTSYSISVPEDTKTDMLIYSVSAVDLDASRANSEVTYSLDTLSGATFAINETTGQIRLKAELDYESIEKYDIIVTAKDSGTPVLINTTTIHVDVEDVNDVKPEFVERQLYYETSENKAFKKPCAAKDKDQNSALVYSILWDQSSGLNGKGITVNTTELKKWVKLDNSSICEVSSIKSPDREQVSTFSLTILVEDSKAQINKPQNDTAVMEIKILDVNDSPPRFSHGNNYKASVQENMPVGSDIKFDNHVSLEVVDDDSEVENSQFEVQLLNNTDTFSLDPETGISNEGFRVFVKNSSQLDYEKTESFTLLVVARGTQQGNKYSSTATIVVKVINENDNIPEFVGAPFSASVKEEQQAPTFVTTVNATDKDKGQFGEVYFSLADGITQFTVNQTTGEVFTTMKLDREEKTSYSIYVTVRDGGNYEAKTQLTVNIEDINDQIPFFKKSQFESEIAENEMHFIPALMVEASDDDDPGTVNSDIKYNIISSDPPALKSKFSINANTGEVTLTSELDYESLDDKLNGKISLTVEAKDQGSPQHSNTTTVTVLVKDVNDLFPQFNSSSYNINKPENTSKGSIIFKVSAIDHDATKENRQVSYSIDTLSGSTFTIGKDTGIIQLKTELNYETVKEYNITVTAVDSGKPALTSTTVVHLAVDDVNDVNPVFDQQQMSNTADENKNWTFTCTAHDQDEDHDLRYEILWSQSEGRDGKGGLINGTELQSEKWIQINSKKCEVTTLKVLDREAVSVFTLKLQVKDINGQTDQTDTATVVIQVNDVNDEPPKFVGSNVRNASIRENMPIGSNIKFDDNTFLEVSDLDEGTNSEFKVTLLKASNIFSISPTTGMSQETFSITVQNSSALDFEKSENFTLEVVARGAQQGNKYSSTATIIVKVINENDNIPEFVGAPFSASVKEAQHAFTFVTTVTAKDADKGQFGEVYFSLADDITEFSIDEKSGNVSTKIKLDRETKDSYVVPIKVRDSGNFSSITQLTITVTDINDNSPEFVSSQFTAIVTEGAATFSQPLIAQATDGDAPRNPNSQIKYTLHNVSRKLGSVFYINETTGEITLTSPLDYEDLYKKSLGSILKFTVTATDQGSPQNSACATVVITVKDANDVAPQFNQTSYSISVREDTKTGTSIYKTTAVDLDVSKENSEVTYSLDTLSGATFAINETTGQIRLKAGLDYESIEEYDIIVTAKDSGTPVLINTTTIHVNIEDVNDVKPEFDKRQIYYEKSENKAFKAPCAATDKDQNSALLYSILWDQSSGLNGKGVTANTTELKKWVKLDNSSICEISSIKPPDREQVSTFSLTILVEDTKAELNKPQNDTAVIEIKILDENDSPPRFSHGNSYTASVQENMPIGSDIKFDNHVSLEVVDDDSEVGNSQFEVQLLNHNDTFSLDPENGISMQGFRVFVKDSSQLDYEKTESFTLHVQVTDANKKGGNTINATITVNIGNENDNIPEFVNAPFYGSVFENCSPGTFVTNITAKDDDKGHFGTLNFSFPEKPYQFSINESTGQIFTAVVLDRENTSTYTVTVKVTDGGGFSTFTQLIISVEDVNDESPAFTPPNVSTVVSENQIKFIPPLFVEAVDQDLPGSRNSELTYNILDIPPEVKSNITINPKTSEITLKYPFDHEILHQNGHETIVLVVGAKDSSPPFHQTNTSVTIKVEDINDLPPVFSDNKFETSVLENTTVGTVIFTAKAIDGDSSSDNSQVKYSIDTLSASTFSISNTSGQIKLLKDLDHETIQSYTIIVTAMDNGSPVLTCVTEIHLQVDDVNDEAPTFAEMQPEQIPENQNFSIACNASDRDGNPDLIYKVLFNQSYGLNGTGTTVVDGTKLEEWVGLDDPHVCEIKTKKNPDREMLSMLSLTIRVEDANAVMNAPQSATAVLEITITDMDDNPPEFEHKSYHATIEENMPDGSDIMFDNRITPRVVDVDSGKNSEFRIQLLTNNSTFTVNPTSGISQQTFTISVKNAADLDFEQTESFTLKLQATDVVSGESTDCSIDVSITNKNDNNPAFNEISYTASILENATSDTIVTTIEANDADKGEYGKLTYSLKDSTNTFDVKHDKGEVYLKTTLDREKVTSYSVTLFAKDGGGVEVFTQLIISVEDVNDEDPEFIQTFETTIEENKSEFVPAFVIEAIDHDEPRNPNSNVTYKLLSASEAKSNFSLDSQSGEITLNNALDFEALKQTSNGVITLVIEAKDKGNPPRSSSITATVTVLDMNDIPPVFTSENYKANISEAASNGTLVTSVNASDADASPSNNQVSYLIDTLSAKFFTIDEKSGEIRVKNDLDREQTDHYDIVVTARDNGQPVQTSTASVAITVLDVNDTPPKFSQINPVTMEESSLQPISKVTATDEDLNKDLRYSIIWKDSSGVDGSGQYIDGDVFKDFIQIDDKTGAITPKKALDREAMQRFQLAVLVEDKNGPGQNDTGILKVTLKDINDNAPTFIDADKFEANVRENLPQGSEIKLVNVSSLMIEDADSDLYNSYNITLTGSPAFIISPTHGLGKASCVISVADSSLLDYERIRTISLTVTATESETKERKSNSASIVIHIQNENDNFPVFEGAPYKGSIQENSAANTTVKNVSINATDADLEEFGKVKYFLEDDSNKFNIDPSSGRVYSLTTDLDRETEPSYRVTVIAKDGGNVSTTTQLVISVTDENDLAPVFSGTPYQASIDEGNSTFVPSFRAQATDDDQPSTENSKITYRLVNNQNAPQANFAIDPNTGELQRASELNYEDLDMSQRTGFNITVEAQDNGNPKKTAQTNILVKVNDINDNSPIFQLNSYSANVSENAGSGKSIVTVTAHDADGTSPNDEVYYTILKGGEDKFQIDSSSGEISVGIGGLDRENMKTYIFDLIVLAIDKGYPSFTATTTVAIEVEDVNDYPPQPQPVDPVEVLENTPVGTLLANITAYDPDEDYKFNFTLLWDTSLAFDEKEQSVNVSKIREWLEVDNNTGAITVASEMDREVAEQMIIKVLITDSAGVENTPQTATATVSVRLLDVNDNIPQISTSGSVLNVSEGTKLNTEVTIFTATDMDRGQSVSFELEDKNSPFELSESGKLVLLQPLDREKNETLEIVVIAIDSGNPPLSSNVSIKVNVLDINDNDPQFVGNKTVFQVKEMSDNTTLVGSVKATDADAGDNANVTYQIKDISPFRIDPISGDIYVNDELNREAKSSYSLTVIAADNPSLEQSRRDSIVIHIDILDINDNPPKFPDDVVNNGYVAKIVETLVENSTVPLSKGQILAEDADTDKNAEIVYTIHAWDSNTTLFRIDEDSGLITVNHNLRGLAGDYSYVITATDKGSPPKSASVNLTITIVDENLNDPVFVKIELIPAVPECAKVGTSLYTFSATDDDKDKSTNGKVKYYLDNSTKTDLTYFSLDADTGVLKTATQLDSETKSSLSIQVRAQDMGTPPLFKLSGIIDIKVTDINDNPPSFKQSESVKTNFSVKEEMKTEVGQVEAYDEDVNASLVYTIIDGDHWKDHFKITSNQNKGHILVTQPLDREQVSVVSLTIKATDESRMDVGAVCMGSEASEDVQDSEPLEITITVEDINDSPPVFKEEILSVGFLSNTEFGKTITRLTDYVSDNDTAANSVHQFFQVGEIKADEQLSKTWSTNVKTDPIRVDVNGSLVTNYKFPENIYGLFTMTIMANDSSGNDTMDLKVYVVGDSQVIHLSFYNTEDQLRTLQMDITQQLSVLGYTIIPDNILPFYGDGSNVDASKSILVAHAVDDSGKILSGSSLLQKLDASLAAKQVLNHFKILKTETGVNAAREEAKGDLRTQYILIAIIVVIAITFVITLYMLIHNIRRFKRKLKAATLEVHGLEPVKQDSFPGLDNDKMKSANPLYREGDVMDDTKFGDDDVDYNSDAVSHASQNSLDDNAVGAQPSSARDKPTLVEQEMTIQLYGSDEEDDDKGEGFIAPKFDFLNSAYVSDEGRTKDGQRRRNGDSDDEDDDLNVDINDMNIESTEI